METTNKTEIPSKKFSANTFVILVAVAVLAVLSGVFFLQRQQQTTSPQVDAGSTSQTEENAAVKTFNIDAGNFYYKPNAITVKQGDKVKIVLKVVDMMHDFNIDELGVRIPITREGNINSVEFTANKIGTFEYYCSVANHRLLGQVGRLIVE